MGMPRMGASEITITITRVEHVHSIGEQMVIFFPSVSPFLMFVHPCNTKILLRNNRQLWTTIRPQLQQHAIHFYGPVPRHERLRLGQLICRESCVGSLNTMTQASHTTWLNSKDRLALLYLN